MLSQVRVKSESGGVAAPAEMTAAVIAAPKSLELRRLPLPEPADGAVRVRIQGCGVCGSDLPVWEGREWFDYPRAPGSPGHEAWGVIDAVGAGVDAFKVGQPVALLATRAYATHDVAVAEDVIPLPPALAGRPFPAEPLACALNAFARADVQPGQTVAVVGIGFFGALLMQLAVHAGARVIAVSRRAYARSLAEECGAVATLALDDYWQAVAAVQELTGGEGCPRVIEATGAAEALAFAAEICGVRARLIIAGYHQGERCVNMQQWNWRGLDVINAHERDPHYYRSGMEAAVAAVTTGRLHLTPLVSHVFALEDLAQAFEALQARPSGFLKAIVTPSSSQ